MRLFLLASICTAVLLAQGQTPRIVKLDIEVENSVVYMFDVADPAARAVQQQSTTVNLAQFRAFNHSCQIDDIVAVNGATRPA